MAKLSTYYSIAGMLLAAPWACAQVTVPPSCTTLGSDASSNPACESAATVRSYLSAITGVAVSLDGSSQGTYSGLNLVTPTGINWQLVPNGSTLSITPQPDAGVIPSKVSPQTWGAGATQTFEQSASAPGLAILPAPASLPNAASAGGLAIDPTNQLNWFDGTSWRQALYNAGSNSGSIACSSGTNSVGPCASLPANLDLTSPTLIFPVINSTGFINANHDHSGASAGGFTSGAMAINSPVASAGTLSSLNYGVTPVTGSTTINTIPAPAAYAASGAAGCLYLRQDGTWATGTAGNISAALTPAAGTYLHICYASDISKWGPVN
jgi:hypothetical protein